MAQLAEQLICNQQVIGSSPIVGFHMARWLSWLERRPVTAEVEGSNPFRVADATRSIILAQLGEHLPYKQRVTGSSPVGPINAGVAELADAQDLKSCGTNLPYRFDSGRRHCKLNNLDMCV